MKINKKTVPSYEVMPSYDAFPPSPETRRFLREMREQDEVYEHEMATKRMMREEEKQRLQRDMWNHALNRPADDALEHIRPITDFSPILKPSKPASSTNPIRHVDRIPIADFEVTPKFYMGVEFEGMILAEALPLFKRSLYDLARDEYGDSLIQFGTDGSIKDIPMGYTPVEIRTKVVRSRAGIKIFEEILCFLYVASQEGDWITNDTCGLHINISEENVFGGGKQIDYYCHIMSTFDEHAVLERWGRVDNKYCLPFVGESNQFADLKHAYSLMKRRERAAEERGDTKWRVHESKYLSVSLRDSPEHDGYDGPQESGQRIEFRAIGGADYHLRLDDLDETVNHIISCVRVAYRETIKD